MGRLANLAATFAAGALLLLAGCSSSELETDAEVLRFDFAEGRQDWESLFTNYDVGEEEFFELEAGYRARPAPLDTAAKALFISGANRSDDLNMYFKRRVGGLEPGVAYEVSFDVRFATSAPSGCAGAGGAPGEGVTVHVAATRPEPARFVDGSDDFYRLNVNRDYNEENGGEDWRDASKIGDVANDLGCEEGLDRGRPYRLKRVEGRAPQTVVAGENGQAWLLVGAWSGFEATTSLYYTEITARLEPQ